MKRAIITGATGQDGALLSELLLSKDYLVFGIDRRTSSKTDWRLRELGLLGNPNFTVVSGDLTDAGSISHLVQDVEPNEFYNLAAMSFVKESWNTPSATMQINAIGTINCLEAIRFYAPECHFYQASSSEMFGGAKRVEVLNEQSRFYPRSPYGISKVAAHWSTVNYRESFDLFASNGILFNHESEFRGLEFVTRKITDGIARIYCGDRDFIELGNMDSKRDWGYAGDFVEGMWKMVNASEPDDFVLATNQARSIYDFVDAALQAADFVTPTTPSKIVRQNPKFMRPADVGHLLGDYSKAESVLGWKPSTSFDDMVRIMVDKDIQRVRNELRG